MIEPKEAAAARPSLRRDIAYRSVNGRFVQSAPPDEAPPRDPATIRAAVMIVHGMGQQVPFETLEMLVDRLTAMNPREAAGTPPPPPTLTNAAFGDLRLQRAEVLLRRGDERKIEAHLYEAYWAPKTEGKVFFYDVLNFCRRGAWNALWRMRKPFYRWMFGHPVEFHPAWRPFAILAGLTVAVFEVALMNLLMIAIALARVLHLSWPAEDALGIMNVEVAVLIVLLALGYGAIWRALRIAERGASADRRRSSARLALVLSVAAGAGAVIVILFLIAAQFEIFRRKWLVDACIWAANGWAGALIWIAVVGCSLVARYFVIQYVGDVAAYVSPQTLDRFSDLRTEIKDCVGKVASAILGAATPDGALEYDRIAFVGHSLGSVIAYDVLNRAILDEAAGLTFLRPDQRVRLLLTFGSPLDKTAMIFGLNAKGTGVLREQMAARVQPLIDDYRHRQLSWVNVFANLDLFSGALDFYDDRDSAAYAHHRVVNVRDEEATVPLAAHEQYWDTTKVWQILHRELFDPGTTSAGP